MDRCLPAVEQKLISPKGLHADGLKDATCDGGCSGSTMLCCLQEELADIEQGGCSSLTVWKVQLPDHTCITLPEPHSLQEGLEEIQLGRLLGRGSFGRVYLAEYKGSPVAVKV